MQAQQWPKQNRANLTETNRPQQSTKDFLTLPTNNVIAATYLNGNFKSKDFLIPRIPMSPSDVPF